MNGQPISDQTWEGISREFTLPSLELVRRRLSELMEDPELVVGVDTHARNHVYAIVAANTGALLESRDFPATGAGINRAIDWIARRTDGSADTLWVIEGAASYGAILAGTVASHGFPVAEAPRMDARKRRGVGKTDALDAHQIAISTLPLPVDKLRRPRLHDGIRQGVRILVTARGSMSKDRTRSINALNALMRGNDLGIDGRKKLTSTQITEVSKWRSREEELSLSIARTEAVRLARHVLLLDEQLGLFNEVLLVSIRLTVVRLISCAPDPTRRAPV